jgi:hypothetical protein
VTGSLISLHGMTRMRNRSVHSAHRTSVGKTGIMSKGPPLVADLHSMRTRPDIRSARPEFSSPFLNALTAPKTSVSKQEFPSRSSRIDFAPQKHEKSFGASPSFPVHGLAIIVPSKNSVLVLQEREREVAHKPSHDHRLAYVRRRPVPSSNLLTTGAFTFRRAPRLIAHV